MNISRDDLLVPEKEQELDDRPWSSINKDQFVVGSNDRIDLFKRIRFDK